MTKVLDSLFIDFVKANYGCSVDWQVIIVLAVFSIDVEVARIVYPPLFADTAV